MSFRTRVAAATASLGLAATSIVGGAAPSAAAPELPNIVDIVVLVSGDEGFDRRSFDYDLLREALVATNLVEAVATTPDITVFAPNDRSFIRLAQDLGYDGRDEAGVFGFLAAATGYVSPDEPGLLDDVLLYHVAPGAATVRGLQGTVPTLLGADLTVSGRTVVDGDPDDADARIRPLFNVPASNGIIQTVSEVLRPINL